jgi:hypothetical protein
MSTTTGGSTYGSISNAPGWREENQQNNKAKSTAYVTGGSTFTTTTAASYGGASTAVSASATVSAATTAIRTVRAARTKPTSATTGLPTAKVTGTVSRKETGAINTLGSLTGGTGYTDNTYTNIALSGGSGYGATANITVSGGVVTVCTLSRRGQWYVAGEALSCQLIGTGTNFSIPVSTITQG